MNIWLDTLYGSFANMLTILNMLLIVQVFFGVGPFSRWLDYLKFAIIYFVYNVLIYLIFASVYSEESDFWGVYLLIYGFLLFVVAFLTRKQKWKQQLKYCLLTIPTILIYSNYAFVMKLFEQIFHLEGEAVSLYLMFADILLISTLFLYIGIYKCKKRSFFPMTKAETILCTILSFFSPVYSEILTLLQENMSPAYSVVWVVFVVSLNVAVFYGIIYRGNARHYRSLSENYKQQFDSEYTYFQDYKEQQQDVVKFRHDWKNHMLLLQSMLDQGEYDKAKDYFSKLPIQEGNRKGQVLTGNEVVDIILSAKQEKMSEAQIHLSCKGSLEPLQFMEAVDCCILFSNLIDNAIEANEKCEDGRYILIQAVENPGLLMVRLENKNQGAVRQKENHLLTTKEDGNLHGIGTQNAFEIIEKYGGEYKIDAEEDTFAILLLFPLH